MSMNILFLSDLHLEFGDFALQQSDADVIVLAGDIWTGAQGVTWARESSPKCPIIYVAGNHEHWEFSLPNNIDVLREAARDSHVHVLENDAVVIKGVTFHGATLWTNFELFADELDMYHAIQACRGMDDFRKITLNDNGKSRHLQPLDIVCFYQESMAWLQHSLTTSSTRKNIVVTHHAPSMRSLALQHTNILSSAAFASHLDDFILTHQPQLWIHGHTHHAVEYYIGDTCVVSNPRGYMGRGEVAAFDALRIICV